MSRPCGMPISRAAARIASTALPRDWPGALSNPSVAAGYWATRVSCSGTNRSRIWATAASGVDPPEPVRSCSVPSASVLPSCSGCASRITRYWLGSVKKVERTGARPKGAVERVIDRTGTDRKARRGVAVDVDEGRQPLGAGIGAGVAHHGLAAQALHQFAGPAVDLLGIDTADGCTVFGRPGLGVDDQVLRGLQIQLDTGHRLHTLAQPPDDDRLRIARRLQVY